MKGFATLRYATKFVKNITSMANNNIANNMATNRNQLKLRI